jgi:hypothetical protein
MIDKTKEITNAYAALVEATSNYNQTEAVIELFAALSELFDAGVESVFERYEVSGPVCCMPMRPTLRGQMYDDR